MKKRFAAAVCLIATALSLSACGGSGQTETTAAGGAAERVLPQLSVSFILRIH